MPHSLKDWRDRYQLAVAGDFVLRAATTLTGVLDHLAVEPHNTDPMTVGDLKSIRDRLLTASNDIITITRNTEEEPCPAHSN
ncbi:hypothetical protein LF908_08805 [Bifidobacterium pseudolongum]|nr:hypothetical protein [Bifidobacterium pseudolongum]MCH4852294.1 hypothetical protein [Bifidobacterium pseudolongum]